MKNVVVRKLVNVVTKTLTATVVLTVLNMVV